MPSIVIKKTDHEPQSAALTGLQFSYDFESATGWVSIQRMPPVPFQDSAAAYRTAIEDFARELLRVAQNPQWITEAHPPQGKPSNS